MIQVGTHNLRVALEWRENHHKLPDSSLFLNNLYVGSIAFFDPVFVRSAPAVNHVTRSYSGDKPWRAFAIVSEDGAGSHVGWFRSAALARAAVEAAIMKALNLARPA